MLLNVCISIYQFNTERRHVVGLSGSVCMWTDRQIGWVCIVSPFVLSVITSQLIHFFQFIKFLMYYRMYILVDISSFIALFCCYFSFFLHLFIENENENKNCYVFFIIVVICFVMPFILRFNGPKMMASRTVSFLLWSYINSFLFLHFFFIFFLFDSI